MDVIHARAAGIDISKRDAKVAIRAPGKRAGSFTTAVKTFGATTKPDTRTNRLSALATGHHSGDGSNRGLLETVLLCDGRLPAGDVDQCQTCPQRSRT